MYLFISFSHVNTEPSRQKHFIFVGWYNTIVSKLYNMFKNNEYCRKWKKNQTIGWQCEVGMTDIFSGVSV